MSLLDRMEIKSGALLLIFALILSGCGATTYKLTKNSMSIKQGMTAKKAANIVLKYSKRTSNHTRLCIVDLSMKPKGNLSELHPLSVFALTLNFRVDMYPSLLKERTVSKKMYSLNLKDISQIEVSATQPQHDKWCENVKQGYFLAVISDGLELPSKGTLLFNVVNQREIDELLAAITYLSPRATLVSFLE